MKRDLTGYGRAGPTPNWPNNAKVVVNFVVNYEEGGESSPLYGDQWAETYGGEFSLSPKAKGERSYSQESLFEYGAKAGIWRLTRLFDEKKIPLTFFVTGLALQQNGEFAEYLQSSAHEVAGHGWRWFDYNLLSEKEEKAHVKLCVETLQSLTGKEIKGWYTGRRSPNTRNILRELGGFLYDSDDYSDDFPFYRERHLIIPYSLVTNDFRYVTSPGVSGPDAFFELLKESFDALYRERRGAILNIGLHPRISGHPGRSQAIFKFIEYLETLPSVWIAKRDEIARHWHESHNPFFSL